MYGDVILTRDVTERGRCSGDVGTVVERHAAPGASEGCTGRVPDKVTRREARRRSEQLVEGRDAESLMRMGPFHRSG